MRNFTLSQSKLLRLISLVLLLFVTSQTRAQFPYSQSFKNSTAPGVSFGGSPSAFLTGGFGPKDGYTDLDGSGYLRLTNRDGSQKGIVYSDIYSFPSAYGMTISFEYYTHSGNGADGIAFILFDATATATAGAFGGSLGYAQRNQETGFSKGYLGIGIDEYGNFSANNEGKSGGASGGVLPSNITLRGAGSDLKGYDHLISVQTTALASSFNVAGGNRNATNSSIAGFRKMEVVLKPRTGGGFFIDVYLTHGSARDLIINNYEYKTTAPPNLKFAISSSTGGSNNFHEIRNLNITVDPATLLTPIANADSFEGCIGLAATSGDITANDNGAVNTMGTINKSSVDLDPATSGIQTTKTVSGQGVFTYDSTTGKVTFTPIDNTIVGPVTINYTFDDSYGKTSNSSTITYKAYAPITNNSISPGTSSFCDNIARSIVITGAAATDGKGSNITYRWESSSNNITFGTISGATNQNYTTPSINTTMYYRRIASISTCSNVSNVASVVYGGASAPTATAATAITCNSFTANWNTVPNATSYGLEVSTNSDFSNHLPGYNGSSLTTSNSYNVSGLISGQTYYLKVWSHNTCGAGLTSSNVITVVVGNGSVAGTVSSAQTICSGTSPQDLTLTGYTGTIQWQSSINNSAFNNINGATAAVLTSAQMGALTTNTYYRAVVKSGSCTEANSTSVLITISPVPSLASVSQPAAACAGSPARMKLTGLLPGSTSTITYSIDGVAQTPITGIAADVSGEGFFETAVLTAANNGKTLRVISVTTTSATPNCTSTVNRDVTLNVNAYSVGGTVASVPAICAGSSPANLVLSSNTGSVLRWQKSTDAGFSTFTDINITSTTLTSAAAGNLTANTYFRAVVQNGVCSAVFSDVVLVTVNALPIAYNVTGAGSYCSGGSGRAVGLSNSQTGVNYQLKLNGTDTGSPVAGNGNAITFGTKTAAGTYTVKAVNATTSCSSTMTGSAEITIDTFPGNANNTTSTAAICSTDTKTLSATPAGGTWSVVLGGGTISGTTYTPAAVTANTNVTIKYTVAANGSCASTNSDVTFTVNPFAGTASNTTSTASICSTDTKTLSATPAGGTWSVVLGGGTISGTTYTPAAVTTDTNVTIKYTVAANGSCASTNSDVSFTVNPFAGTASNTTSTAAICSTDTKTLSATPAGGTWSVVLGGGTISGTTYTPAAVTTDTNVTIKYTVAANGSCASTNSDVSFTVNPFAGTASNTTSTAA
ncbi:fibronectin type III domain-containing protein, partial [Flavobacterium bizetiae]|uniref:fibronectin type III domain-containing protein n=2 Tax=Flavobacterium bizetiae TaxID=2704140 RepID=UPI0018D9F698